MNCLYCKGELRSGKTTYVISRHGYNLTIGDLAAHVCTQCGEALLDESAVKVIQQIASDLDERVGKLQQKIAA